MTDLLFGPEPLAHQFWRQKSLGSIVFLITGLFLGSQALAHGTHARFLAPQPGEATTGSVKVHIDETPKSFPYVHLTIRRQLALLTAPVAKRKAGKELWSGLVPLSEAGYVQALDVSGWTPGPYVIEAKFVGDFVEHTNSRVFVVAIGDSSQ